MNSIEKEVKYYVYYITYDGMDKIKSTLCMPDTGEEYQHYGLYAVTKSKNKAARFERFRDMRYFRRRTMYIPKKKEEKFLSTAEAYMIEDADFETSLKINGREERGVMTIEIPIFEYDSIIDNEEMIFTDQLNSIDDIYTTKNGHPISEVFVRGFFTCLSDEYRHIFNKCYMPDLFTLTYPVELPWDIYINFNQLMIYVSMYGDTYRKEGILGLCASGNFMPNERR